MRRALVGLAFVVFLSSWSSTVRAQAVNGTGFSDPFFLYYGYFLPQQAYLASIPRPEDTVREISARRQVNALTERAGLYDPLGSFGGETLDPFGRGAAPSGSRMVSTYNSGVANMNLNGSGPPGYFNRVGRYYPGIKVGRGPNSYVATSGRGGGSRLGAGYGMSGAYGYLPPGVKMPSR